ncbi:hypothetical protein, partial [Staphylococcus aureus]|uniref:hypothetical protein n=1 Tax=Staphylococcus aureus TaxID=1280 RepID=UPI00190FA2ED
MLGPARSLALDPGLAPHLSAALLTRPGAKIVTTLDAGIQRAAITALKRQLQGLGGSRARDGAVVVVDNAPGRLGRDHDGDTPRLNPVFRATSEGIRPVSAGLLTIALGVLPLLS